MSTDTADKKEPDLFVTEDLDGTATVDLPDDMDLHDGGDVSLRQAGTPEEQDEADARAEAAEIAATGAFIHNRAALAASEGGPITASALIGEVQQIVAKLLK